MEHEELIHFIRQQLQSGYPLEEIKEHLLKHGWSPEAAEVNLAAAKAALLPTVPVLPPIPVLPSVPSFLSVSAPVSVVADNLLTLETKKSNRLAAALVISFSGVLILASAFFLIPRSAATLTDKDGGADITASGQIVKINDQGFDLAADDGKKYTVDSASASFSFKASGTRQKPISGDRVVVKGVNQGQTIKATDIVDLGSVAVK